MQFVSAENVRVKIRHGILDVVFDECDQYDTDETGGRIVGVVSGNRRTGLILHVDGIIPAGPEAERSPASLFQDGDYQERAFRAIEDDHPSIRPLGSWHTHHVNGYPQLSQGDITTYERTVNHQKHPLDCFYALLVTRRVGGRDRYRVLHYVMFRGEGTRVHEIHEANIELTNEPALVPPPVLPTAIARGASARSQLRPARGREKPRITPGTNSSDTDNEPERQRTSSIVELDSNVDRALDHRVLNALYPGLQSCYNKRLKALYWRGSVTFADGSDASVLVVENEPGAYTAKTGSSAAESTSPWLAVRQLEVAYIRQHLESTDPTKRSSS